MFFKKYKKRTNKKINQIKKKYSSYPRRIQKSAVSLEREKQYYNTLMQKYKKYGYLSFSEQVWLENNAHKFDY